MPTPFGIDNHTVNMLFDKYYEFYIPAYQRSYEWNTESASRMIEDIWNAGEVGKEKGIYFLGSIVLAEKDGPHLDMYEHQPEVFIIDGQQRITTIVLLLSLLRAESHSDAAGLIDGNEINDLLIEGRARAHGGRHRFNPAFEIHDLFRNLFLNPGNAQNLITIAKDFNSNKLTYEKLLEYGIIQAMVDPVDFVIPDPIERMLKNIWTMHEKLKEVIKWVNIKIFFNFLLKKVYFVTIRARVMCFGL